MGILGVALLLLLDFITADNFFLFGDHFTFVASETLGRLFSGIKSSH